MDRSKILSFGKDLKYEKLLELSEFKGFADSKLTFTQNMKFSFWKSKKKKNMEKGENAGYLNNTIQTFKNPEERPLGKHFGKRRKCWLPAFSPFHIMFSTLPKRNVNILASNTYFVVCKTIVVW